MGWVATSLISSKLLFSDRDFFPEYKIEQYLSISELTPYYYFFFCNAVLLSVLLAASLPIISEKHCSLKLFIINTEEGGGEECSLGHVLEALHYNVLSICGRE